MERNLVKIIATLGPASEREEVIEKLLIEGVDIFRFNLKHNKIDWHDQKIKLVNKVAQRINKIVGTLIDLQGPEIRILLAKDNIEIKKGDMFLLENKVKKENGNVISLTHPQIIKSLKENQKVLVDDWLFEFRVRKLSKKVYLESLSGGVLGNRKTINFVDGDFDLPLLTKKDLQGLKIANKNEVDYVALSFVRSGNDIKNLKKILKKLKVNSQIIAKIETKKALDNIDEVIKESDGLMVARGDLGVELSMEEVPYWQKVIIEKCLNEGKFVIVATQMLKSMINNSLPTRAEISDIANAVYDGADALMLSEETAIGNYPIEAVKWMRKTIIFAQRVSKENLFNKYSMKYFDTRWLISSATFNIYQDLEKQNLSNKIIGFLVLTETGSTAKIFSRFKFPVPIFAIVREKKIADGLIIYRNVVPIVFNFEKSGEVSISPLKKIIFYLKRKKLLTKNGYLIVVHGDYWGKPGKSSVLRIVEV